MRCKDIRIELIIPVPINEPDGNGNKYLESAVKAACENADGIPITTYNERGQEIILGAATTVEYKDGFIRANGWLRYGGTSEQVKGTCDLSLITSMNLTGIGLCD